jgi:hypothetical protein
VCSPASPSEVLHPISPHEASPRFEEAPGLERVYESCYFALVSPAFDSIRAP